MKIFCIRCLRYVLKTSDKFKCGGPYNGEMFAPIEDVVWHYFSFTPDITDGSLQCPMCDLSFIDTDGSLLTEYGLIPEGMTAIDTITSHAFEEGGIMVMSRIEINPGKPIEREVAATVNVITGCPTESVKEPELSGTAVVETTQEIKAGDRVVFHGVDEILEKQKTIKKPIKKPKRSKKKPKKKSPVCKKCGKPMRYGAEHKAKGCPE